MFTTVMNLVINEAIRHPTTTSGLPAASASTSPSGPPGLASGSHGAGRTTQSRWFRRRSKPAGQLPETYRVLASTFMFATLNR